MRFLRVQTKHPGRRCYFKEEPDRLQSTEPSGTSVNRIALLLPSVLKAKYATDHIHRPGC